MWEVELPPSGSPPGTPALPPNNKNQLTSAPSSLPEGGLVYIPSSDSTVAISGPGTGAWTNPCCNPFYISHHDSTGLVLGQTQLPNLSTTHNTAFPVYPQLFSFGDSVFIVYSSNNFVPSGYDLKDIYKFDLTNYTLTPMLPSLIGMQYGWFMASSPDIDVVIPTNLLTNGGFDGVPVPTGSWMCVPGWAYDSGWGFSVVNGQMVHTPVGGGTAGIHVHGGTWGSNPTGLIPPWLVIGSTYEITFDVISGGANMLMHIPGANIMTIPITVSAGVASATWTQVGSNGTIGNEFGIFIIFADPNGTTIDNVVVKEVIDHCVECYNVTSLLCDGSGPAGFTNLISGAQTAAGYDGRCLLVDGQPVGPQHIGTTVSVSWVWGSPPPAQLWNFEITGLVPVTNPVPITVNTITAPCPPTPILPIGPTPIISTMATEELTAMSSPQSTSLPIIPDEILKRYPELFK